MQVHSSGFTLQFSYLVIVMLKEKLEEHKMELLETIKKNGDRIYIQYISNIESLAILTQYF